MSSFRPGIESFIHEVCSCGATFDFHAPWHDDFNSAWECRQAADEWRLHHQHGPQGVRPGRAGRGGPEMMPPTAPVETNAPRSTSAPRIGEGA